MTPRRRLAARTSRFIIHQLIADQSRIFPILPQSLTYQTYRPLSLTPSATYLATSGARSHRETRSAEGGSGDLRFHENPEPIGFLEHFVVPLVEKFDIDGAGPFGQT